MKLDYADKKQRKDYEERDDRECCKHSRISIR